MIYVVCKRKFSVCSTSSSSWRNSRTTLSLFPTLSHLAISRLAVHSRTFTVAVCLCIYVYVFAYPCQPVLEQPSPECLASLNIKQAIFKNALASAHFALETLASRWCSVERTRWSGRSTDGGKCKQRTRKEDRRQQRVARPSAPQPHRSRSVHMWKWPWPLHLDTYVYTYSTSTQVILCACLYSKSNSWILRSLTEQVKYREAATIAHYIQHTKSQIQMYICRIIYYTYAYMYSNFKRAKFNGTPTHATKILQSCESRKLRTTKCTSCFKRQNPRICIIATFYAHHPNCRSRHSSCP